MRSHLFHLLKEAKTNRKISYWYGARSVREMFYHEEFLELQKQMPNFMYTVALNAKLPTDNWTGAEGFIHDVCDKMYLSKHPDPTKIEYYLCGPPMMIDAVLAMLDKKYKVPGNMIVYDKF
jgi:Na+-transporting NADH:ubiquinone oxidoreductase subunit F